LWMFGSDEPLGYARAARVRRSQSLQILRREGYRKRLSVFLGVCRRAGFGNCNDLPAPDDPGQCDGGCGGVVRFADLRQRAVTYYEMTVAAKRRIGHHRHSVLCAPWQKVALDVAVVKTVNDLIGRAAIPVRHPEQIFHLAGVEIGYSPSANLPRGAQLFEFRDHTGELRARDRRVQQIEVEIVGAETSQACRACSGNAISSNFVGLHLGDQIYAVAITGDDAAQELLGAAIAVITRRID